MFEKENDDVCNVSIEEIFKLAVKDVSYSWSFYSGFKRIYNNVKRSLFDSFIRCEYVKGNKTTPPEMKYFVKASDGRKAIVHVYKHDNDFTYTYHITI